MYGVGFPDMQHTDWTSSSHGIHRHTDKTGPCRSVSIVLHQNVLERYIQHVHSGGAWTRVEVQLARLWLRGEKALDRYTSQPREYTLHGSVEARSCNVHSVTPSGTKDVHAMYTWKEHLM